MSYNITLDGQPILNANVVNFSLDNIEECNGIIVMLDALGIKNLSVDDSKSFILNFNKLINLSRSFTSKITEFHGVDSQINYFMFQDTIIFTLDVINENKLIDYIYTINDFITKFFVLALNLKIYLRGAISYGKYLVSGNSIYLGEAIYDAAQWYEEADWLGIIYTPNTGKYIWEELSLIKNKKTDNPNIFSAGNSNISNFDFNFIYFNVPIKNNKSTLLWVSNWLQGLILQCILPELDIDQTLDIEGRYYALIKFANVPKGTESKYANTNRFFNTILKNLPDYKKIILTNNSND